MHEEGLKACGCWVVPGADKEVMELHRRKRSGCREKFFELSLEIEGKVLTSVFGNVIASPLPGSDSVLFPSIISSSTPPFLEERVT